MSRLARNLEPGDRVRLHAPSSTLTLRSDLGTLVGLDPGAGDLGYWIVRLDEPALYDHGTGPPTELTEVCEMDDNLTLVEPA